MRHVKEIWEQHKEPISINELHKRIQKRNASVRVEREDLEEILNYYHKLSVVYVNNDKEVMFI